MLEFEKSVVSLEKQLSDLRTSAKLNDINVASVISKLQEKIDKLLKQIYSKLTPWDIVQVARLPERPKFSDYLNGFCDNFIELSGDRLFGDDRAIIGGFATIDGQKCIIIGQEKGSDTESRIEHNFGMPMPEGYRKVLRLMELADRFNLPIINMIDTSGAYPGLESEERGQAESIARCIEKSFSVKSPMISIIIGEGGSGGAVAMATTDYVLMLEYSIYSVISPEGCASILWKDDSKAPIAASIQHITAQQLHELNVIDDIIKEPLGGAHRNKQLAIESVKNSILQYLNKSKLITIKERIKNRRNKFQSMGNNYII
ncbi:MAG: acetyl-CoA carboxylase carboxyltransferase subunit alpha [Alphaproteobacteria bacterium]|nr:acetyl-CoA carboxylase carboxyltransferase subunit alpha [Alphaproteobacteria bacterium]